MSKKYEKHFFVDPHIVDIHPLANKTPKMTKLEYNALEESIRDIGQLQPAVFYRNKLLDGRHRLLVCKKLGIQLEYINLQSNITLEEVEQMVTTGYENRRHQTPTQKAISAYKYYIEMKEKGEKVSMGEAADKFSVSRQLVDRAKKADLLVSPEVFDQLWSGSKLALGGSGLTDSLLSVINYYKTLSDDIIAKSKNIIPDLTDDETAYINELVDNLTSTHNNVFIKALSSRLFTASSNEK